MGEYYRFIFVKDEGFREAIKKLGVFPADAVEGKSYDEIISTIDPEWLHEALNNENACRWVCFGNGFVNSYWYDDLVFEPFLPEPFRKIVMQEFTLGNYIDGKDIDAFMAVMEEVYGKVKRLHDDMVESQEKKDFEEFFLNHCLAGFEDARKAIHDGFRDRIIVGWR